MLAQVLSIILFAALLVPQAGQAHVHLCLDGEGPAVSLHTPDSGEHCVHVDAAGHHDHTFELDSPAIGKLWPPGLDFSLLAVVPVLFNLPRQAGFVRESPDRLAPAALPLHLRPPLRGPPA